MKRVVVTGMAGITSLGSDWDSIAASFAANRSGIRRMDEWDRFEELNTRLAGPIDDFKVPAAWTRKQLRSMGRVSGAVRDFVPQRRGVGKCHANAGSAPLPAVSAMPAATSVRMAHPTG